MSDAPERIWADGNAEWDSGSWGRSKEFDNDVEYVRADRIEELEAKLAKAVEALQRIADASDVYGIEANADDQGADTLAYAHRVTGNLARATLAAVSETHKLKGEKDE
jgi:hypothetical protein